MIRIFFHKKQAVEARTKTEFAAVCGFSYYALLLLSPSALVLSNVA